MKKYAKLQKKNSRKEKKKKKKRNKQLQKVKYNNIQKMTTQTKANCLVCNFTA